MSVFIGDGSVRGVGGVSGRAVRGGTRAFYGYRRPFTVYNKHFILLALVLFPIFYLK